MSPDNPQLKKALKMNQPVEMPMDDAYFDRLHDRIMAAIEQTEIAPPSPWDKPKRLLRAHWKSWVVSGGSLMMIFAAGLQAPMVTKTFIEESHTVQVVRNEDAFISETLRSPEDFSETLISYQNQSDFFVDVAERSFHDLSQEHVREIMGRAGL